MSKDDLTMKINAIKYKLAHREELGTPTEVYSRVTGYYRPVSLWCDGKVSEFNDRQEYAVA